MIFRAIRFGFLFVVSSGCVSSGSGSPPRQNPPPYAYPRPAPAPASPPAYYGYGAPPATYPAPAPRPATPPQAVPTPAPIPQAPALLSPLVGMAMFQAEVRAVLLELVANLGPQNAAKVRGIPLRFDPDLDEINAFAGCDERGSPFLAGTAGLLEAVDAISQTTATDDLYGTHTYDAYANAVLPKLVSQKGARATLPAGVIPAQYWADPRRLSHARELFDDVVAFTFGHELGHHYLGHTGCANGQTAGGFSPIEVAQIAANVIPALNQPNEVAADGAGTVNVLDTGRARRPAYRFSERGGLLLLDFFARMERTAGFSPFNPIGFLLSHPNSAFRSPIVQAVARTWYAQHPG